VPNTADEWRRRWEEISDRADRAKDSPSAIPALFAAYAALRESERPIVDAVLAEAIESDDERDRFDALALVREFRIVSAAPSLERLAEQLKDAKSPGAPYELAKVSGILTDLR
jgi:hypothetical protein